METGRDLGVRCAAQVRPRAVTPNLHLRYRLPSIGVGVQIELEAGCPGHSGQVELGDRCRGGRILLEVDSYSGGLPVAVLIEVLGTDRGRPGRPGPVLE